MMEKARGVSSVALLGMVIALLGCGGSAGITPHFNRPDRTNPIGDMVNPPAPSVLRQVTTVIPGVFRYGSQYVDDLPSQMVSANGNVLQFEPDWAGAGLNGAAYAIYGFNSTGYTTDDTLHLAWRTCGASSSNLWLGLASFTHDRWDWFAAPAGGILPYDAAMYTNNRLVYVIVLCLGSDPWSLSSISISADVQPVVLSTSPTYCTQGIPTVFTAAIQGFAESYSWDFGGGAVPNTSTACTPEVTPATTGIYSATLTVANVFGQDVFSYNLQVGKSSLTLSLTNPPATGAGTVTEPYQADVAIDYLFHLADSDAGDVTLNANSHYHVSDEVNAGAISNLDAVLNITDAFIGSFYVTADYPDAFYIAHNVIYFIVAAPIPELEIYPDISDPDWSVTTGTGTESDPYILDAADLTRVYSLLADDKLGTGGNPIPVASLTWKAVPEFIANWTQAGAFRAKMYADGYLIAQQTDSLIINSNRIYITIY